jgi:hypothetical protein
MKIKKNSEFDNILDDCLERLVEGDTVEQCLEGYPGRAPELEPLLRTAQAAREAAAIAPRAEFRARARYEFRSALHDEMSRKAKPRFVLRRGWVTALMVVGILLVSGGGAALAADDSMPDSPLYSVKLATERVQMALTPSSLEKAQLCAKQADRRVSELIYLASKGDTQQVEAASERLDERLTTLVALVSPQGEAVAVDEGSWVFAEEPALSPTIPSAETETVPVSPTSPALQTTPAPAYEEPPPEETDANAGDLKGEGGKAELRGTLVVYLETHPDALRSVLDDVSPSVQAVLIEAIAISETAYLEALAAMD